MNNTLPAVPILMADDDADDRLLARDAIEDCAIPNAVYFVEDGEELMDYLMRRGRFADALHTPRPGLILLDLNMPRKNGHEALAEIKADADLQAIPVVVFTTSQSEDDRAMCLHLGASDYRMKPQTYDGLVTVMNDLKLAYLESPALVVGWEG